MSLISYFFAVFISLEDFEIFDQTFLLEIAIFIITKFQTYANFTTVERAEAQ